MSFTTDVCEELVSLNIGKNCCKKALICGLFWQAETFGGNGVRARFKDAHVAEYAVLMLESRYSLDAEIEESVRAGRKYYTVSTESSAIRKIMEKILSDDPSHIWELLDFRCGNCRAAFLRGVFISSATLNDPKKSYHLEFSLSNDKRAQRLFDVLSITVGDPRRLQRGKNIGLYYKTNDAISDLVYYIGGTKSSFEVANTWVERDIRNNENRATNCVARNISRSVSASQKHISAIEKIRAAGKFEMLSDELKITAKLRMEYNSASLAELALLHDPPISKSGLNQRLTRLLEEAEYVSVDKTLNS